MFIKERMDKQIVLVIQQNTRQGFKKMNTDTCNNLNKPHCMLC